MRRERAYALFNIVLNVVQQRSSDWEPHPCRGSLTHSEPAYAGLALQYWEGGLVSLVWKAKGEFHVSYACQVGLSGLGHQPLVSQVCREATNKYFCYREWVRDISGAKHVEVLHCGIVGARG